MSVSVPKLEPRPLGRAIRLLGLVHAGTRRVTSQIEPYTEYWDEQNQEAIGGDPDVPLLVAVGDSVSIGIGASAPERGLVGLLRDRLQEHHDRPWRVINLALSGARVADAIDRQLPVLDQLSPTLVTCCIGTNDVVWGRDTTRLRQRLRQVVAELPPEALVSTVAGGSARARLANRALTTATREHELPLVSPWREPGPGPGERLASDGFHPNDLGYFFIARAFARALGLPTDDGEQDPTGSVPAEPGPES